MTLLVPRRDVVFAGKTAVLCLCLQLLIPVLANRITAFACYLLAYCC